MVGPEERSHQRRSPLKPHAFFNNYPKWKDKLRENCYKRVREDRARLLWKMRLPEAQDASSAQKDLIELTFQNIVSNELRKIKNASSNDYFESSTPGPDDDVLWEYDGLNAAYEGECEEILLEMQRIFYEDLRTEQTRKDSDGYIKTWEDEEDEYLTRLVYEHMQLGDEQVHKEVWCPICKRGELQEKKCSIYCNICELELDKGDEVTLELLQTRLADTHTEHLERGCRLKPSFRIERRFGLTALYIECHGCSTFEIVI